MRRRETKISHRRLRIRDAQIFRDRCSIVRRMTCHWATGGLNSCTDVASEAFLSLWNRPSNSQRWEARVTAERELVGGTTLQRSLVSLIGTGKDL